MFENYELGEPRNNQLKQTNHEKQSKTSNFLKKKQQQQQVVIAIGGNAILENGQLGSFEEQFSNITRTAKKIASIMLSGADRFEIVALTHGNGPQVGNIAVQQDYASSYIPRQPMHLLIAMTQGQIGYMLQHALQNELKIMGIDRQVISVITQTLVDRTDPQFSNEKPSKPIGPFYTYTEAQQASRQNKYVVTKVKPTGEKAWRRVVPSPRPVEIVESEAIKKLIEDKFLVIASGGGGIPVVQNGHGFEGIEGVVDKDLVAALLAKSIGASILLRLTDIDRVMLNFGKPNQTAISKMTVQQAKRYMEAGQFLGGSMGPKIDSSLDFIEHGGECAIITSIDRAMDALNGNAGTRIVL